MSDNALSPSPADWALETLALARSEWRPTITQFWGSPEGRRLWDRLDDERRSQIIFPHSSNVLRAFELTPLASVKVVILGQDPYHGWGEANGLAFAVPSEIRTPPSLRNILKELGDDLQVTPPVWWDLQRWAAQGVLLLNTTLTVRQDRAGSHRGWGWNFLTDEVIRQVNRSPQGTVFFLWGQDAQQKRPLIDGSRHLIVASAHPSPLSAYRGFFGSRPFSTANQYLESQGRGSIAWLG